MDKTGIEYADMSWNPWQGCHRVSAGCDHCYMARGMRRWRKDPNTVVRSSDATFNKPLRWKGLGRVFVCSWSDFFIEEADAWRAEVWEIIRQCPHLTFIIVTKRPERIEKCLPEDWDADKYGHVWLVATIENQEMAEKRVPILIGLKDKGLADIIGLSIEPMLGQVDIGGYLPDWDMPGDTPESIPGIDWVVIGAESGPGMRHCNPYLYMQPVVDQCQNAGVKVYVKQVHLGTLARFRLSKNMYEWPAGLRVREFPKVEDDKHAK